MSGIYDIDERRERLAGPAGVAGLLANKRLFGISMLTALGGLCYGYEQGAFGQAQVMPSFTSMEQFSRIVNDSSYRGWAVAILGLGGWVGSLVNGYCCDRFSRRWSILGGAIVCVLGAIITAAAMNDAMIFVGRFLIGLSVGSLSTAVPTYNSEISSAEVRGTMVGTWQLSVTLGIMISYWVGFGTNYISATNSVAWRLPAIPALGLAIGTFFIPYSPRWLLKQGRDSEALTTLAYVRNRDVHDELVQMEFLEIKAEAMFERESAAIKFPHLIDSPLKLQVAQIGSLFTTWAMFRRTAIACLMMFFQQMSGIDAIVFYAPIIFASLGLGGTAVSLLASGVVGISMFLATFPSLFIIDKLGRRPLLIIGGLGMSVCLIIVGVITSQFQHDWASHTGGAWASAAFIWLYIFNFGYSWGPVSWVVISEVMPLSARAPGTALGASTNWMTNFCVSFFVPPMLESITYGTYLFFTAFMLLGVGYAIWILPETRNVSLEAMDKVFNSNDAVKDAELMRSIMQRLQAETAPSASDDSSEKGELKAIESV